MSRAIHRVMCGVACAALLAGCQSNSKDADFSDTQKLVAARTGFNVQWNGHTEDDAAVADAVNKLLSQPLTADQIVQIALLNNRHLQATFEDLGIAQADLVQAGLLKNPVFELGVRFPDSSPSQTYLDIAAMEDFLDIVTIPVRKKLAAEQFAQAKAEIADQVLKLVAQTRKDFYTYQAAEQIAQFRRSAADTADASFKTARAMHDAGNLSDFDFAHQRAEAAMAKIDQADAAAAAMAAREKLNDAMGLSDSQIKWTAAKNLPDMPKTQSPLSDLESLALHQRQDLEALRHQVVIEARKLGLTSDYRFFQEMNVGAEFERETDGQWRIGPAFSFPLPLFDQGQAKMSRAKAVLRQSEERYLAMAIDVRSEVRAGRANLLARQAAALLCQNELLPAERDALRQTQLQYNGMYVGVFQLLIGRRQQIDATARAVEAVRDYWIARAELERAIGGRLPAENSATQPTNGEKP